MCGTILKVFEQPHKKEGTPKHTKGRKESTPRDNIGYKITILK